MFHLGIFATSSIIKPHITAKDATNGARTAYTSRAHEFHSRFLVWFMLLNNLFSV